MPVAHLRDIGASAELRALVAQVDIKPTTIPVILDRPRTLRIIRKLPRHDELVVECQSAEAGDDTRVVLYLPYRSGARASAKVITYSHNEGS